MCRARRRGADKADLVLWLADDGTPPPAGNAPVWCITTKADLASSKASESVSRETLAISTLTGHNLDELALRLADHVARLADPAGAGVLAHSRHRDAFAAALSALDRVAEDGARPIELVAEDLRAARFALDRLIGVVDVEDILDDVFGRFCIGK